MQNGRFLGGLLLAALLGVLLESACCLWIDRPVAYWVYDRGISTWDRNHGQILERITDVPEWAGYAAPGVIVVGVVWFLARPSSRSARVLATAGTVYLVSSAIKEQLKLVLGRSWPETWQTPPNPSLISNGVYGFHWFHGGDAYSASPSGHTTVTVAVMTVLWFGWPKLRVVWVACAIAVGLALVLMDYHFVGDVVGGAFLGAICGAAAARLAKLA